MSAALDIPAVILDVQADQARAEPLLSARDVSVCYPRCAACSLDHVSLKIYPGERMAVVGPSGGGKTTLLRTLEGSVRPNEGVVDRRGTATLVYQDLRLVAEQTVLANVCSGAFGEIGRFRGVFAFPLGIRERAERICAELGLTQLAGRKVGSLSGGQRQRVAIARALISRPRILLADEPLASLDAQNGRRILQLFASLQKKYDFALVISTHNPGLVPGFFKRYVEVHDGRVDEIQPPRVEPRAGFQKTDLCIPEWEPEHAGEHTTPQQDRALHVSPRLSRMMKRVLLGGVVLALLVWSAMALNLKGSSFAGAFGGIVQFLKGIVPGSYDEFIALPWKRLALSLVQTIQMAVWGTAIGIGLSLPLAVLGSRQTGPALVRAPVRFLLNVVRTVPSIFWALLFVAFVGLGPIAGVFALAAYSVGYLTKFFYEGLEDVDSRPVTALRALGATQLQAFCWAVFPAARAALIGACLFVFEYNIRSASVLGVVGAGGIGQDLMYYIEWRQFPAAAAGLLMILVVVIALDALSQWWRRYFTRQRGM